LRENTKEPVAFGKNPGKPAVVNDHNGADLELSHQLGSLRDGV
jgi:hypothetical protein